MHDTIRYAVLGTDGGTKGGRYASEMNEFIATVDPRVLEFWKTVATVAVAVAVGFVAATLQYRQWRTTKDKLKLDLFERRIKVYEVVTKAALPAFPDWYKAEEIEGAAGAVRDAQWLFGDEVQVFLRDLMRLLFEVHLATHRAEQKDDDESRLAQKRARRAAYEWAESNMKRFDRLMEPYLRIGR